MKREETFVRVNKWQGGKISELVHPASELIITLKILYIYSFFSRRNGKNIVELLST
jgi:hypothetical protein